MGGKQRIKEGANERARMIGMTRRSKADESAQQRHTAGTAGRAGRAMHPALLQLVHSLALLESSKDKAIGESSSVCACACCSPRPRRSVEACIVAAPRRHARLEQHGRLSFERSL